MRAMAVQRRGGGGGGGGGGEGRGGGEQAGCAESGRALLRRALRSMRAHARTRAVAERSACGGVRASRAAHFAGASSPRKKFFRLSMSPIAGAPALRTACEAAAGLLCSRWAEAATGTAWKPCAAPASASTRQVRRIAMSRSLVGVVWRDIAPDSGREAAGHLQAPPQLRLARARAASPPAGFWLPRESSAAGHGGERT